MIVCTYMYMYVCSYVHYVCKAKVKLSCSDPYRPFGLQEVRFPRTSRQSAHKGGKVVSPTHRPP